ncbi:hypothetical protein [Clostridium perfringens]|uniref:hypothetical protein n=1 Tax=Clostridium perfringens TaxID=1502 RepID=UPI00233FA5D6|nr:hypothetical protein [Clostridium perfringens]MDC4245669.1 hypothetical protein [Clostridium perfringens]
MNNFEIKQRIRELIKIIYNKYSCVGGQLHIVLDDENIENDHIEYCLQCIDKIEDQEERNTYKECAELLLKLSYSARKRLLKERIV